MTQEEKQLLLKDLCARLPYHPRVRICNDSWEGCQEGEFDNYLHFHHAEAFLCDRIEILPYLRTMSSMTDEERKEFNSSCVIIYDEIKGKTILYTIETIDWLNSHHFDYRGLIEKNLALDCTGLHIYD